MYLCHSDENLAKIVIKTRRFAGENDVLYRFTLQSDGSVTLYRQVLQSIMLLTMQENVAYRINLTGKMSQRN